MSDQPPFEERICPCLDTLHEAALLLAGDEGRAEALLIGVAVDASRRYHRDRPGEAFLEWILGRLVRRYRDYVAGQPAADESAARGGAGRIDDASAARLGDALAARPGSPGLPPGALWEELRALPLRERLATWLVGPAGLAYRSAAGVLDLDRDELVAALRAGRGELQARLAARLTADRRARDGLARRGSDDA